MRVAERSPEQAELTSAIRGASGLRLLLPLLCTSAFLWLLCTSEREESKGLLNHLKQNQSFVNDFSYCCKNGVLSDKQHTLAELTAFKLPCCKTGSTIRE